MAIDSRPIRKITNRAERLGRTARMAADNHEGRGFPSFMLYQQMQLLTKAMRAWAEENGQDPHFEAGWRELH